MLGLLTKRGVPIIEITIAGAHYRAIIDTGFNGDLQLPESLRGAVNPRFFLRGRSLLAGGLTLEEDVFRVGFPFDGRLIVAEATFANDEDILIGTRLLKDYRLTVNFVAQTVRLQRIRN